MMKSEWPSFGRASSATGEGLTTFGGEKLSPSPAKSFLASSGGVPFSRMQRARISFVERTKETDSHTGFPVRRSVPTRRRRIHWRRSVVTDQLPEMASTVPSRFFQPILLASPDRHVAL